MIRKILGRLAAVRPFAFAALALASFAASATDYIDASGNPARATCTPITSSTTTLETGWYVVEGPVSISSTVTVNGDVNLILADGAKLTVSSTVMDKPGICVEVVGSTTNSLSIYCQDEGSGELHSSSSSYGPGIGTGGEDHTCGIVTIYGGVVYATGSSYGSGIGSGWKGSGGSVTINGGTVTAIGGTSAGAGIGGGYQSVGGTVIINGGTVVAKAQNDSYAGIGGQSDKDQGSLTVGGNVVVKAGNSESLGDSDIRNPNGETSISLATIYKYYQVELTGPKPLTQVTSALAAYAGEAFNISLAPTISGGSGSYTFSGTVPEGVTLNNGVLAGTLSAGVYNFTLAVTDSEDAVLTPPASYTLTVTARPKSITYKDGTTTILGLEPAEYTPGTPVNLASYVKPGYTFLGWYDNDGLAGDAVTAVSAAATEDLTFWASCSLNTYTIQYYDGATPLTSLVPTSYTITQTPVNLPTPEGEDGYTFAGWCTTMGCTDPPVTSIAVNATGDKVFYAKWTSNTPGPSGEGFIDDDPEEPTSGYGVVSVDCQTASGVFLRKCKQLASGYWAELNDSWYYVTGEVTIESVEVAGKASLILGDGATLTVGSDYTPGIQLTQGNTLTIYGQSGGTGVLIATGGDSCAGIGGGMMDAHICGKLNVYGGNITATGSDWASGIGSTSTDDDSTGGQIYVYGGTVTAIAGDYFGGIGGYKWYGQGSLVVGENMTVTAGADAGSAVELTPDANGVVTLSAQKYFHIESAGDLPLAQSQSAFTKNVGDTIALSGTISGGKKPYAFSGTVPTGLTLADGTITCNTVGTYNFSLTVTDADSTVIQATYAITVEKKEKSIIYIDGTDGVTVLTGLTPNEYTPGGSTVNLPNASAVIKAGYTFNGWYLTPELDQGGSQVYAIYSWDSYTSDLTLYAKFTQINYTIIYYDHNNDPLNLTPSAYTIADTPVALPTPDSREGFTFDGWCENSDRSDTPTMTIPENSIPSGVYYKAFYAKWTENAPGPGPGPGPEPGEGEIEVQFVDANGDPMQQLCTVVTADTATFTNGGWYVVNADVSRDGTIAVEGSANLVLVDDETLTITGSSSSAGISVTNGCSLTIYGQSNGTGAIDATGGSFGAGIGGNCGSNSDHTVGACGTVVINGGTITANGTNAAGIGGGTYGNGGTVTINRGTVDADGGNNSAGIGGGQYGSTGGTVTINGGAVHAEGSGNSAGIGGGARCSGAVVTINGGNVRADSGVNAGAGIGSGRTWGDVVVSNGSLRVAATMTVYASTNLFETAYTAEHIREVNSSRFLEVENDWHSFLIEESVATVSQIHYYDGYSPVELEPSSYEEGTATPLATPSKNGFTFEGWCDNNALTGDAIKTLPASATGEQYFYAKWTPIVYSITYYLKGVPVELEPSTYTATNALTMLPEYPNGYYVSWYTNDQFTGEKQLAISYGSYGNKEFWAKISSAIGYKAEFYDGETLLTKPSSIFFDVESDTIVLPRTAYKDGYRFIGWYDNVGLDGDPVTTIPAGSISNKQFYAKWEATTDPVFTVDSEGNLIHFALNSATEITIPNNVYNIDSLLCYGGDYSAMTSLVIPGTVTNIGDSAFSSCTGLTNLTIEAGVKTIGDSAFFGCTALTCGEDGLYIPDSVTSIGNNAFVSTGLAKVSLPGAMYSVENDIHRGFGTDIVSGVIYRTNDTVFYISDGLLWAVDPKANTDITIPARVDSIGAGALHEITTVQSVQLHSGITNIAVAAFSGCTGLQSIDIPGSVECIGNGSFDYCTSLTNVTIGSGVKLIDTGAFLGCTALASVAVPGSVECISEMAFWDCTGLSSLTIEYGVKTIEEFAFCGCSSLVNVTLPKGLEIERYAFVDCTSLKSVNIGGSARVPNSRGRLKLKALKAASENPDAITVGEYAFIGCRSMESATIGSTVEDIGGGAFGGCPKLAITIEDNDNYSCENGILYENDGKTIISAFGSETSLVVPSGVTNILDGAFTGYSTLTSVVLPSGVTTIGEAAFSNATVFASITIPASVTTIGANAFCDTQLATVYVSKGDTARVKTLVEGTGYTAAVMYVEPGDEEPKPSIAGDGAATVTGDAERGYVVTPSTATGTVEVEIPSGLDPAKVTVEVPATASVKPNGANVAVVKTVDATSYDITGFLDIPAADANGVINLGDATVKDAIVEEVLDPEEGAVLVLTPENPSITTAETRAGLTYTFYEGTTLDGMTPKATKVGDGNAWTPAITVKGGASGFYSVHVSK